MTEENETREDQALYWLSPAMSKPLLMSHTPTKAMTAISTQRTTRSTALSLPSLKTRVAQAAIDEKHADKGYEANGYEIREVDPNHNFRLPIFPELVPARIALCRHAPRYTKATDNHASVAKIPGSLFPASFAYDHPLAPSPWRR
jgi:hypothetical protein